MPVSKPPTKMVVRVLLLATLATFTDSEYIPPGPAYPCPKVNNDLLHPCVCEKGSDDGLFIRCENSGLAVLSVGLGNIAGLGLPIEQLIIKECQFSNLMGPLLHRSTIRVIHIEDTPIETIDEYAFAGVNRTLQELYMVNTRIEEFPKDAFKILGNLTKLSIDGHLMTKLGKDIFSGSASAGRLEKLHLVNGLLNDVPVESFQALKKLKTLDLHGNKLDTLKRNQFKGLRETEVLDLSYNNIVKLDGSHMGDMTKLGWCNASHNQISEIPRGMFARNTIIKVVHLDNNKLKKLDTNSFRGLRFLRRLYLQDNQISDIGRGTFSAVTRIGTVDLARNKITKVDFQMFEQVKYAELINLAENNITIIETQAFTDLYQAVVNISYNALTTIEGGAFRNCNNMTLLDFSHNTLKEITKYAFDENSYAFEFNVAFNDFEDFSQIPIQNMSGIQILNASYNRLETIPKLAFPKLYELHTVDLSHNNLTEISNAVFQNLFSLRFLDLSYNSMEVIKSATFGTLPTVLSLSLKHNRLRDVSRGSLSKLASCRTLDISHNQLDKIFQISISLSELNIAHNNLKEIKPNTWPSMNALLSLNVSHNNLGDSLEGGSLHPLLTLQRIDLSYNNISIPPKNALQAAASLQYLYMKGNNLPTLEKSAFGNLPTLFHLDASSSGVSEVCRGAFAGLRQLQTLILAKNELATVPNEAFKDLVALRELDLSYNMLEKIDNKTNGLLDDCLSLEKVDLSHNSIGFLTRKMFPHNPWIPYKLREVDLSYNVIPVLTYDITLGTKHLRKLNLTGNYINDIRSHVLGNLTSLEILDLSHNNLEDLISRTAVTTFKLPENISELYLQNNKLIKLPTDVLIKSEKLRVLDVRYNQLTSFDREIVKKVRDTGMSAYFEGNFLKCDCHILPLKHYLNHMTPSILQRDDKYSNLTCAEPVNLESESLLRVDEERLICGDNVDMDSDDLLLSYITLPDVAFRDVQYAQSSIYAHWFVVSTKDVTDFVTYIRDKNNTIYYTNTVSYNQRFVTIPIDTTLADTLKGGVATELCVQAQNSKGLPRKWYPDQCRDVPKDFTYWPKILNVDKRRLSKKASQKYRAGTNSVLALVSDSILLTLCIFLGVCLKLTDCLT